MSKVPVTREGLEYLNKLAADLQIHNDNFSQECIALISRINAKETLAQYKDQILDEVVSVRQSISSVQDSVQVVVAELHRVIQELTELLELLGR